MVASGGCGCGFTRLRDEKERRDVSGLLQEERERDKKLIF